ncbi:DUF3108 domain-containing protein [Caldimonas brevitalea]|uniref:DUF3108 domain-containing protein n=1 Tax=Caldimonas brevitalea TaxID=413882 RepID=A0A0G3BT51_9BURK|nr:DUF3108 domain-containing protein [Caldimonas brevitalea]AKJ31188.1 hypothetical protein AAW51_4497 [Caldimonas brevitalea]
MLLLVLFVALSHFWLTGEVADRLPTAEGEAMPQRLQVMYTRQLELAPPPPAPAPARRPAAAPRPRRSARVPTPVPTPEMPAASASAPDAAASVAEPALPADLQPVEATASAPEAVASAPVADPAASAVAEAASAAAPSATASGSDAAGGEPAGTGTAPQAFEWPPSTRMSYTLSGYYRGEVSGSAQVEWIKEGDRYQVHVDVYVGPSFAPLMSRRMSSDGAITPDGLAPRRYDEVTSMPFRQRRASVVFEPEWVTLNNGRQVPAQPGVQDTASQFVQLTQRLLRHPELLRPGQAIEFPLALPRRQDRWRYDVVGEERLETPFGSLPAYHLVPRREVASRDELTAEIWFAPSLMYLPVRIRIQQDAETYIDLMLSKLPEQALPVMRRNRETPP